MQSAVACAWHHLCIQSFRGREDEGYEAQLMNERQSLPSHNRFQMGVRIKICIASSAARLGTFLKGDSVGRADLI